MLARRHLGFALFLTVFIAAIYLLRVVSDIGWGNIDVAGDAELSRLGIAQGYQDNLSYAAWAQQARDGIIPFEILQTTEPHDAIFVAPIFVLIGKTAALLDAHPLVLLNVIGPLVAGLALWFVFAACLEMGLSRRCAWLAVVFVAYGSGLSVLTLTLSGYADWAAGADSEYLDLIPAAVFPFFPYHGLGLASICALLYVVLRSEKALMAGRAAGPWLALCFITALIAVCIRPYTPTTMVVIYAAYATLAWVRRDGSATVFGRLWILLAIAASIAPFAIYYFWVGLQPVWADYRAVTLDISFGRLAWLIGFGVFWPVAIFGVVIGHRRTDVNVTLVSLWGGLVFALLLVLNIKGTKLADGGFIALALLSAIAADHIWVRYRAMRPTWRRALVALTLVIVVICGSLSTVVYYTRGPATDYYRVDREVVLAAQEVRQLQPNGIPNVLTESRVGAVLPAMASIRVYVGHWSLTRNAVEKAGELIVAGFETASRERDWTAADRRQAMAQIRAAWAYDYILVRKTRPAYAVLASDPALATVVDGARWALFRRGS